MLGELRSQMYIPDHRASTAEQNRDYTVSNIPDHATFGLRTFGRQTVWATGIWDTFWAKRRLSNRRVIGELFSC